MDDAEILIPDREALVTQVELFLSGYIKFDDNGFHITKKGHETAIYHLKKLPLAERALICAFFATINGVY